MSKPAERGGFPCRKNVADHWNHYHYSFWETYENMKLNKTNLGMCLTQGYTPNGHEKMMDKQWI